ncbi:MAG: hypothetical protein ABI843_11680 [Dokdonella sp.]
MSARNRAPSMPPALQRAFAQSAYGTRMPATDPPPWPEQKVAAGADPAYGNFGYAVAISGATAIIGAPQTNIDGHDYQGTAYVFTESDGVWTLQQQLIANDGTPSSQFGHAVAIDGDTALVGAQIATVDGHPFQGAAYVFTQSAGVWTQTQKLSASDGAANGNFGGALALHNGVAIIGAYNATVAGASERGEAYVFAASGGSWTEGQQLIASDGVDGDQFGHAVAFDGTTAVIGAWSAAIDGNVSEGAAYVFTQDAGSWTETQKLVASDGAANDEFSRSIALSGATLLIGSAYATVGANANQGALYAFNSIDGYWSETQKIVASDGAASDSFGYAAAIDGATAVVGANGATVNGNGCQGKAYVLELAGGVWSETQTLSASDSTGCDFFGYSVGLADTAALVGADLATVGSTTGAGAAYFYVRPADDTVFADGFDDVP